MIPSFHRVHFAGELNIAGVFLHQAVQVERIAVLPHQHIRIDIHLQPFHGFVIGGLSAFQLFLFLIIRIHFHSAETGSRCRNQRNDNPSLFHNKSIHFLFI